jgi:tyramine---L-glutamate ligase
MTWKGNFGVADIKGRTVLVHEWVTGGGLAGRDLPASWAAEGRAMRRAIAADFACLPGGSVRVIVTSDARLADEPGPWKIVPIAAGDDAGRLSEIARTADFTVLIAPETSGILAGLTRELEYAGARLLGSTAEAVELTADKARLAARLQAIGVNTPPTTTIVAGAGIPEGAHYPAVLKPIDGAGSLDTFYLADVGSVPDRARQIPIAVLQPFVPGTPMSASFLVGQRGEAWLVAIGTQRMAIREGRFEYRGGRLPAVCPYAVPQLKQAVKAIAGLRGFVGVDFIGDTENRQTTILEINPRPTTSFVGLCCVLPPGLLARSWLAACGFDDGARRLLAGLAERAHEKKASVSFNANGEFDHDDVGAPMR